MSRRRPKKSGNAEKNTTGRRWAKGRKAEKMARDYLKSRGIKVLQKNFRPRRGELDIIARDGDSLCIVEVRSRDAGSNRVPEASLSPRKIKNITGAANSFVKKHRLFNTPVRFDLLVVNLETREIKYYPGGITPSPPV